MRCLGPARARTAAYMNISISSRQPSGKRASALGGARRSLDSQPAQKAPGHEEKPFDRERSHGVGTADAMMTNEANDPGQVRLFGAVRVIFEAQHLPALLKQFHEKSSQARNARIRGWSRRCARCRLAA